MTANETKTTDGVDAAEAAVSTPLFVDQDKISRAERFVAWLDVLGAGHAMKTSHARAANFVMRIHVACLEADGANVALFPMNDGVFVVAKARDDLTRFLRDVMLRLATVFTAESVAEHRFLVRGAIAHGFVSCGSSDLAAGTKPEIRESKAYLDRIAIGMPLVQAYEAEKLAPPFGFFVHESARMGGDKPIPRVLFTWWREVDVALVAKLRDAVKQHYAWVKLHPLATQYPDDAARRHEAAATEYFQGV